MFCSACGKQVAETARFCSHCGGAIGADETVLGDVGLLESGETLAPDNLTAGTSQPAGRPPSAVGSAHATGRRTPSASTTSSSSEPIGGGRFAPGAIVAQRYRIVALLGKGGMGEVYRAEDLRLSQVLAIKFLPEALSQDAA
ncbi:MAG TPA: protein kinase family protein, partial [Candidatus Acidoferrales bacterium]|nr:protein kinase family protein [Candidatus Acidoferrales bacterium]